MEALFANFKVGWQNAVKSVISQSVIQLKYVPKIANVSVFLK